MKAIIIISACLLLAVVLRIFEAATSRRMKSVGAKSNKNAKNIATMDINDPESIQQGLAHYKDLDD